MKPSPLILVTSVVFVGTIAVLGIAIERQLAEPPPGPVKPAAGKAMPTGFTYDIQMAGYAFGQFDEKGPVTHERFVEEFRRFPWASQVGQAQGRAEPTISVHNRSDGTAYWVSAMRQGGGHVYLVGIVYPTVKAGKPVRWAEIYVAEAPTAVEQTSRAFFAGETRELLSQLHALPRFDEMEAKR